MKNKINLEWNRKIVEKISVLVEKNPDLTMHQILMNHDFENYDEKKYYETSEETDVNLYLCMNSIM